MKGEISILFRKTVNLFLGYSRRAHPGKFKFRIHRTLERYIGYRAAYVVRQFIREEYVRERSDAKTLLFKTATGREPHPSLAFTSGRIKLDFITVWPPQIGGPSEIAPYMRFELANHFAVRTLVIGGLQSTKFTDSVLPFEIYKSENTADKTLLIVAFGSVYDSSFNYALSCRNLYVLWHDPIHEKNKQKFLQNIVASETLEIIFVNSKAIANYLEKYGVPNQKIHILRNGAPAYRKFDTRIMPKEEKVIFSGTWSADKYTEEIFKAFLQLANQNLATRFVMIGFGDELQLAEKRLIINNESANSNFTIKGYVEEHEWERHLNSATVAINLRKAPALESSGSLMDLISAGVPTLTSPIGATAEIVLPGLHQMTEPVNVERIISMISSTLSTYRKSPDKWTADSRTLQDYARTHSLKHYAEEVATVIKQKDVDP